MFENILHILSLFDQLRLFTVIFIIIALLIFVLKRQYLWSLITFIIISLLVYPLCVYFIKFDDIQLYEKSSKSILRIIQQNCWSQNKDLSRLLTELQQRNPDIIFLQECSLDLFEQIYQSSLSAKYTIFSQFEFNNGQPFNNRLVILTRGLDLIKRNDHTALSLLQLFLQERAGKKRALSLINTHLNRPYQVNFNYYKRFTNYIDKSKSSMILAGDFNLVPWSRQAHFILKTLDLQDTRQGYGFYPTYPARLPYPSYQVSLLPILPIDHIFVSADFMVHSFKRLPLIGSDHLGIQVDLTWS